MQLDNIFEREKLKSISSHLLIAIAFFIPLSTPMPSILSAFIILIWLRIGEFKKNFNTLKSNKVILAILFLTTLYIMSLFWSDDLTHGLKYTIKKESRLLLIPLFMLFAKKEHIKYYLYAFVIGASISELFSYAIFFGIIPYFGHATYDSPNPFLGHIVYSPIIAMAIYILLYYILFDSNISKKEKIIYGIFFTTMTINLFISGGRAGQVMFFGVLIIILFQYYNKQIIKTITMFSIITPLILVSFYSTLPNFKERVDAAFSDIAQLETDRSTSLGLRITFALNSMEVIKDNPIFGVGSGGFKKNYEGVNQKLSPNLPDTVNPHNTYIFVLVELGLIGIFAVLAIFFFQLKHALTQEDIFLKHLGVALPLLFLLIMLSESYLFIVNTAFMFVLFSSFLYKKYPDSDNRLKNGI
ncbi:MAG: O-antigen ligase family protein [Sulfurimonas sp.]|uniref:O-antigen ligase family protein n=1 Tax=Sulfurimonas sp. TaxID=2022749 RepID=UPI00261A974B|nr:O-antigen ligase family protein [Sulfurimonas sp.]MDD2653092.1 O-antigen ligase family protein [Sulfurimonas sp.]MDD3452485.1 O-antigen ligase family protein [Sulfurimonas sp.]